MNSLTAFLRARRRYIGLIPKNHHAGERGALLLSLAIFIIALGIITSGSFHLYELYRFRIAEDTTQKHLDVIETALADFFEENGRMPCVASMTAAPDSEQFGIEVTFGEMVPSTFLDQHYYYLTDGTFRFNYKVYFQYATLCNNVLTSNPASEPNGWAGTWRHWGRLETLESIRVGAVPTRTLGIDDKYMLDGWGRRIVFAVDTDAVDPDYWVESADQPGSIYVIDDFEIKNQNPSNPSDDGYDSLRLYSNNQREDLLEDESVTTPEGGAIYVLVAPGQDSRGAYNLQGKKIENCEMRSKAWENCDYEEAGMSPNYECSSSSGYKDCWVTSYSWQNGDNVFINLPQKQYGTGLNDFTATLRYKGKFQKGGNE